MVKKNARFMWLPKPRDGQSAGCLKSGTSASGDESTEPLVSPEDKCAATNDIQLIGKIELGQYFVLVSNGYNGEEVMRWTCHHANQVICKKQLVLCKLQEEIQLEERQLQQNERELRRQERRELEKSWAMCPICGVKISTHGKLRSHISRVHGDPSLASTI